MITYTFRRNWWHNEPGSPLSEEEARARGAAGKEYTAVMPPQPTHVHLWTYPSDEPRLRLADASSHETRRYREDGYVQLVIFNEGDGFSNAAEYTDVPVDDNWEPMPAFGEYVSIGRVERGAER